MTERRGPLFVERQSYRRRRLVDMIRMMPVIGGLLWAVPLLWPRGAEGKVTTSDALIYVFGVWLGLVLLSAVLARLLRLADVDEHLKDG